MLVSLQNLLGFELIIRVIGQMITVVSAEQVARYRFMAASRLPPCYCQQLVSTMHPMLG
jgi:hypothetical protein